MFGMPFCAAVTMLVSSAAFAGRGGGPGIAENPHVQFLKSWLEQSKSHDEHAAPTIRFRFADELANAVHDQDRALVSSLLPLYTQALEAEIQLSALELSVQQELSGRAQQFADQLHSLVALLGERPAGGTPGQIERETLAAASIPFETAAAESLAKIASLRRRLDLLGAQADSTAGAEPPAPASTDAALLAESSPVLGILDLLTERRLASLASLDSLGASLAPLFIQEESVPAHQLTMLGPRDRFSPTVRTARRELARLSLAEAIQRRLDAIASLQPLVQGFSQDKLARMLAAAELADRQYRQGAIPLSLLVETQKAVFEAHCARTAAQLKLWRETLELRTLSAAPQG